MYITFNPNRNKGTVLLHDVNELLNYNQSEEDFIHNIIKQLSDMGVGVIIVGEKISEMAIHYIDKYKLVAMRLVSKWTLHRLCRATSDLGVCSKVYTQEIGNDDLGVCSKEYINNCYTWCN